MKEEGTRLGLLLLLPLLVLGSAVGGRAEAPPSGPVVYTALLPAGYYEYFPVFAFANSTVVHYTMTSNVSASTSFMTRAQFQLFNESNGLASNSISYHNGASADVTLRVGPGSYYLLVYADRGAANATLSVSASPNNPLASGPIKPPQPTGIASFGLANESGAFDPYSIASTDVIGLASIASMQAFNASAKSAGVNPSGATLQLNSMLVVEQGSGSQVYWCQNTPDFVTAASQLALSDNVWNASAGGTLTNESITSQGGAGYVSSVQQNGTTLHFYAITETNSSYSLPLGLVLLMNATTVPGTGVTVQFGAKVSEAGALPRADWFDNVTIHDPAAKGAYFATDGNYSTPLGTFYDTELVFAGEGGGESTNFTSLSAALGLFYANGTSARMSAFPSYYSFGQDTEEAAGNLMVSYLGNGQADVSVGTPNYVFLGPASGTYALASVEASLGFPSPANTTTTTTTPPSTTASSQSAASSTSGATSSSGGIPEFPYQLPAAAALVLLTAISYLVARRRITPPGQSGPHGMES